jgi:hypothetical protein
MPYDEEEESAGENEYADYTDDYQNPYHNSGESMMKKARMKGYPREY